ncbi:ThuA domain-containing protein [Blastococcus sp. SYSU D00669]
MAVRVLVVTGGHRVDLDALLGMVAALAGERGWVWAHALQPSAQDWLAPEHAGAWDALLLHDLPGLHLRRGEPPEPRGPAPEVARAVTGLLERGVGVVATHHALAGWPAWDGWADALGGRFFYAPGVLHGEEWPSSGTRITAYTARVVAPEHPVCAGLADFALTDEPYCCPVFTDRVVPLLRHDADVDPARYVRTYEHVLVGEDAAPDCTGHPPASDLVAWATTAAVSPVVYVQPGDGAATFGLPGYRRLIGNAVDWVASPPAHEWARSRPTPIDARVPAEA